MAIKTIENVYINENGYTNEIICPICSTQTFIKIITSSDYSTLNFFLKNEVDTDFGICTHCSSVFKINPDYSKARAAGTTVYLTPDDLTKVSGAK